MTDFLDYLARISGGEQRQRLARIAEVSPSTVTRWDKSRQDYIAPKAEAVMRLARRYGVSPLEALAEAGVVSADEVNLNVVNRPLSAYPHSALLHELQRRLDRMSAPDGPITSPADYGEEPDPDDYSLAAGDVARDPHDPRAD